MGVAYLKSVNQVKPNLVLHSEKHNMALLCFNSFSLTLLHSPLPSSSSILAIPSNPVSRVHLKHVVGVPPKCLSRVQIKKRKTTVVVRAAAADGVDGTTSAEEGGGSQSEEVVVSVEKLPLESKLKERQEQQLRMKLAKKIRLRRKRLVRKRKLRKKGRWPPSKMKKLKNV